VSITLISDARPDGWTSLCVLICARPREKRISEWVDVHF
jgi:hypothetical protein